jgi:hypothetical protein
MARPKKNREINIVHFSFFDLLFGAFGAFVFLMIMQVLSTLNLVDVDIQNLVDETVQEKVALAKELEQYKETDQLLHDVQQQYDQILNERKGLIQERQQLLDRNGEIAEKMATLEREAGSFSSFKEEAGKKEDLRKGLEGEIEKLNKDKEHLVRENARLGTRMSLLTEEVTSLQHFKKVAQKKGSLYKVLEKENKELKEAKARLAGRNSVLEAKSVNLQKKITALNQFVEKIKKKGNVTKALEEEKKKLEKNLNQTRNRLAALKTTPLKIRTRAIPTTITEEKVNVALAAEGGSPPYTWELDGKLPRGLAFNHIAGTISGVAKSAGRFAFRVKITDARGLSVKTKKDISFSVIKKYEEQENKVSRWFLLMAAISTLLLLYIIWGKYKAKKRWKEMVRKAKDEGKDGIIVPIY